LAGLVGLLIVMVAVSRWELISLFTLEGNDTADMEASCPAFVEAYGTFDYGDPNSYRDRLLELTTEPLRAAVPSLRLDSASVGQLRTISTRIIDARVMPPSGQTANALVVAEQTRSGLDPRSEQRVDEEVVQNVACQLVRDGGHWLVAKVSLLSEEPVPACRIAASLPKSDC
jgi:hypothetical protein